MMKMSIIGAGKWGSALNHAFLEKNDVVISSRRRHELENFVEMDEALDREYIVMTIPAQFVREWMDGNFIDRGQKILVAAKGIELSTGALLNEIFESFLPSERLA
jgi:glycerol-3-phosphate dehydrogenase (NAD(P)+)